MRLSRLPPGFGAVDLLCLPLRPFFPAISNLLSLASVGALSLYCGPAFSLGESPVDGTRDQSISSADPMCITSA